MGGGVGGGEWQTIVKYTRETLFLHVQPAAGLASQFRPLTRSQASSFWATAPAGTGYHVPRHNANNHDARR
jgi:hypothetical protein